MRTIYRFPIFLILVLSYFLVGGMQFLFYSNVWQRRKKVARINQFYCKLVVKLFGVQIHLKGEMPKKGNLVVGNHMSYLDIFLVNSIYPTCFVTSVEMRDTPILGHMCRLGGCLFVERRNKTNIHKEIEDITTALEKEIMVTIFPEATSTNGDEILRFRRPLYNAALFAKKDIHPFCLQYQRVSGKLITKKNRDLICWYGKMTFLGHFLRLLNQKSIEANITFTEVIPYQEEKELDYFVSTSHLYVREVYQGFQDI